MPLFEYECTLCGTIFERIAKFDEDVKCPLCWDIIAKKIFPTQSPSFTLKYNPQTDMVDWSGNRTRYWDDYNKAKSEGKDVRLPKHDGDGK